MSVIPVSTLSRSDLAVLGNNVLPEGRFHARCGTLRSRRQQARSEDRNEHGGQRRCEELSAVNRSLACAGEEVSRLYSGRRSSHARVL
jgi:hypothetical protein